MLICYTAALFNNAVFSKSAGASRVCLCLIRLGQGSIAAVESLVAGLRYEDEGLQCENICPSCTWRLYWRGREISHACRCNYFLKTDKTACKTKTIQKQVLLCWFFPHGTDACWSYLIKLQAQKWITLANSWLVSLLHLISEHSNMLPDSRMHQSLDMFSTARIKWRLKSYFLPWSFDSYQCWRVIFCY